ncbi:hypothetical protein QBC32DRAFT_371554 [Pseudoneurospora amorphoporcata]|uniref:Steroid 5-alpha reductase C-terminal domain-containing protein n=1 Tax=Pseudoneurospora amorphoporcata TaxID=241081 RepID=A0AAN6SF79_9PEZI|nr:hypothetical protein QBC32DRAFT_371554 [Pseudoneurospora amorphoporcata]
MAIIQSLLDLTNFASPLNRNVVPCIMVAYAIQVLVAIPSIVYKSDRFFDASGLSTFLIVNLLSLYLPAIRAMYGGDNLGQVADAIKEGVETVTGTEPGWGSLLVAPFKRSNIVQDVAAGTPLAIDYNWRQLVVCCGGGVWGFFLGVYLFRRILREGHDHRFTEIRINPRRYLRAFIGQATWVTFCMLPVIAVNSIPSGVPSIQKVKPTDFSGFGLWIIGFVVEVVADYQKSKWQKEKQNKAHDEQFLTSGLWSKCQFPNYFGESMLWVGIASVSLGVLLFKDAQESLAAADSSPMSILLIMFFCTVGPAFVTFLMLKVTGVPYAERKYNKLYGDDKKYQRWKIETPKFFPF